MKSEAILWEWIERDAAAHRRTDALFAAIELRLFDVIRHTPLTLEDAATALGTAVRRTRAYLDLMTAYGYLVREGGTYRQSPELLPLTDPGRPDNLQRRLAYPAHTRGSWALLSVALREDRPVRTFGGLTDRSQEIVEACHVSLGVRGYLLMTDLASQVPLPPGARIMDVGGGFGDLCRPFLERDGAASAVVLEAPDTVSLARHHQRDLGLEGRFEFLSGDFLSGALPGGFDLIILSSVLQLYDETTNRESLRRLARCLKPGGGILIREMAVNEDATGPISGLEFGVHMVLNTLGGQAYHPGTLVRLLADAGCSEVQRLVDSGLYSVLLGRTAAAVGE